jgi:predicted glycosyltransferase involved in capsule biosynthesis
MLKRLLPKNVKQFLWFIVKSPQRKWIGYSTLFLDLRAYVAAFFNTSKKQKITVCVGVKNRTENLLSFLITSMNACKDKDFLALSVCDCGSTDVEDLKKSIQEIWKGDLKFETSNQDFARTISFNRAVKMAETELVLICDADMSLPKHIVSKVVTYTGKFSAWFPVVWYTNEDGSGRYYTESTGMMACKKAQFLEVGAYDERIKKWGKEDWLLFFEFYKHGLGCIRSREPEFIHHYHNTLKPDDFVPLF